MKHYSLLAAASAATLWFAFGASSASAQMWTFDTNAQGWQIADFPGSQDYTTAFTSSAVTYHATGGRSGGYISGSDPSSGTFMFAAPTASLGNYSGFLGGKLTFSLETDQLADWTGDSVVVFRKSTGLTIIAPLAQPGATWTDYSIDLVASSFRYNNILGATVSASDLAAVLGDLGAFYINAEYHNGATETTGLDSVIFTPQAVGPGAVPEPSTYGAIGAATLLGLAALRRRRK